MPPPVKTPIPDDRGGFTVPEHLAPALERFKRTGEPIVGDPVSLPDPSAVVAEYGVSPLRRAFDVVHCVMCGLIDYQKRLADGLGLVVRKGMFDHCPSHPPAEQPAWFSTDPTASPFVTLAPRGPECDTPVEVRSDG
jgi:hypothetical protein